MVSRGQRGSELSASNQFLLTQSEYQEVLTYKFELEHESGFEERGE